jgi:hypothetical protein
MDTDKLSRSQNAATFKLYRNPTSLKASAISFASDSFLITAVPCIAEIDAVAVDTMSVNPAMIC